MSPPACAIAADDIRRIAAELADVAFEQEITIEQEWTDWAGRKQDRFIGRPVSFHAMRGISAHSNGFHTCRMIHHLQIILGAIDSPGSFRYKPPFPRPLPPGARPYGLEWNPDTPLDGPPIGNPKSPEDLMVHQDGSPLRIDKAYSWENPLSIHGLMHMVLHNAWKQEPLQDRHAVHVYGQYGLEQLDECGGHDQVSDRQGRGWQLPDQKLYL